jgi:hypothetical protein
MTNLINLAKINTTNYIQGRTGKYRFIIKCQAGFFTVSDARDWDNKFYTENPEALMTAYKKGRMHTIEFCPEGGDYWLTVFAKKGNKVVSIDEAILSKLTVGTINQYWYNTNLYCQIQYRAANAKNWLDKAFVDNTAEQARQLEMAV